MLLLYVNDLFLIGKEELIKVARRRLASKFEIKDLGMVHYFLDMEVCQSVNGTSLGQGNYAVEILKRLRMMECKDMATPMALNLKLLSDVSCHDVLSDVFSIDDPAISEIFLTWLYSMQ